MFEHDPILDSITSIYKDIVNEADQQITEAEAEDSPMSIHQRNVRQPTKNKMADKVMKLAGAATLKKDGKVVLRRDFLLQLEDFLNQYTTE